MRQLLLRSVAMVGLFAACNGKAALVTGPLAEGGHHVLFIGNSLTYENDLPGTLVAIGGSVGDTIRVRSVAKPNYALVDHLSDGEALFELRQDRWEYVILQQGPSTLPVNRDSLALWTTWWDPYIRAQSARPALLMVWPDASRKAFFEDCRRAYLNAAQGVSGVMLPAGEAWTIAWQTDPTLAFYGGDNYHPSPLGTYLAALVIYERVTGHDARLLPRTNDGRAVSNGVPIGLPAATALLLQESAHAANLRYPLN